VTTATPPRRRDGCVVATEPLAALVTAFVEAWRVNRPSTGGRFGDADRVEVPTLGAIAWLANESGVKPDTIQNVASRRYRTTELRVADAIVSALGCPQVFHDGTLTIRPNPSAPRAARMACCGGSG
jgi:hypothetical protein